MRAAIYLRESVDRDLDEKAVVRQQEDAVKLADGRGWTVVGKYIDNDVSASSGRRRPRFEDLMADVLTGVIDVIIAWKVDRLVRKLTELERVIEACERHGVKLVIMSGDLDLSTAEGRLVGRLLASVARAEMEIKHDRQVRAARQAAEAGDATLGAYRAFGWQDDRITRDPAEGDAIEDACRALLAGGTVTGAVRDWTARGVRPVQSKSGKWTRSSVITILRNPRNAGIATYKGEEVGRGSWEPLISEETYRAVCALLGDPGRKQTAGVRTMIGGYALCPCGNHVTGARASKGHQIYRCNPDTRDGRPGPHVNIRMEAIDAAISEVVIARMSRADAAALVAPQNGVDVAALREETAAIRARLASLGARYALGGITDAVLDAGTTAGNRRLEEITAVIAEAGRRDVLADLAGATDARAAWKTLPDDRKRAVIRRLMTITLHPAGRGARTIDPAKIIVLAWK